MDEKIKLTDQDNNSGRVASYVPFSIDGITLYNDDCLTKIDSLPSIGCVVTSPPYNFNLRIHTGKYEEKLKQGELFNEGAPNDLCEPGYCYI